MGRKEGTDSKVGMVKQESDFTLRAMRSLLAHFTYLIAYTKITEHTLGR